MFGCAGAGSDRTWNNVCDMVFGADKSKKGEGGRLYNFLGRVVNKFVGCGDSFDKLLKAAEAGLQCAIVSGVSDGQVATAHKHAKTARSFIAITKGPVGLWRLMSAIQKIIDIVKYWFAGASIESEDKNKLPGVALNTTPFKSASLDPAKEKTYADRAVGATEAGLALSCAGLEVVGQALFTVGFGVCKTTSFAVSTGGAQLTGRAKSLPGSMGIVMFGNHIAGVLCYPIALILRFLQTERYIKNLPQGQDVQKLTDAAHRDSFFDHVMNTLSFLKNTCELLGDVALFTPMTAIYKAITAVLVAFFDLLATWIKTSR